jgi:DNA recombination protein RmuC
MRGDLKKAEEAVTDFDRKREKAFGEVSTQLRLTAEQTGKLQDTTGKLQVALANTRVRGQWGERMAEDILQLVGFVENINYTRQTTQEETGRRPDYTFILPQNLKVNMDVKFPLDNYMNYLNAAAETDKEAYRKRFMDDTRQKVREIKSRDYINPQGNTVDYALMFIPNEQVYCFLHENDSTIFDNALANRVILCSPVTLFAILCVIRQSVQLFQREKTASESLALLDAFGKQWESFKKTMDTMGKRLEDAQNEYHSLMTTRTNQLEKPLSRIKELQEQDALSSERAGSEGVHVSEDEIQSHSEIP